MPSTPVNQTATSTSARRASARSAAKRGAKRPRAPRQDRSRLTLDRLLDATEKLLEKKPFEAITIAAIVRQAKSSVGSFYARFPTKEALLPALYERYDAAFREDSGDALATYDDPSLSLVDHARLTVTMVASLFRDRHWFMRAMALHARIDPKSIDRETRENRAAHMRRAAEVFLKHHRDEIAHDDPIEAFQTALFMISATCRDKILFGEAPHAETYHASDAQLIEQMTHAMVAYLVTPPSPPAPPKGRAKKTRNQPRRSKRRPST